MKASIRAAIGAIIEKGLERLRTDGAIKPDSRVDYVVERPKKDEFGDFSTNAAMLLAPIEKKAPRAIAEALVAAIGAEPSVARCNVAGPGFVNIFLDRTFWLSALSEVLVDGETFGSSDVGRGKKVQVEFVSANPTGPLHIGHGRGAAVGDSLARILSKAGFAVTREFYINDTGRQMRTLGASVYARYMEAAGRPSAFPEDGYKGSYVMEVAKELLSRHHNEYLDMEAEKAAGELGERAGGMLLERIERDLADFRVSFDVWYSEKSLHERGLVEKAMGLLRDKGFIFEQDGATWFRTTDFKDDKDRVLVKADGSTTYFASDIAYHAEKIERGFDVVVDVWGADHHGYQPRVLALFRALGARDETFRVLLIQLVTLLRNGEPVPMGKREGEFVTLRQVMDEVGVDACRFFFLMRRSDAQLDFDLDLARKAAPENPVYYVQYCHARIMSILAFADEKLRANAERADSAILQRLDLKEEIDIIKKLAAFPETVETSALLMEPHRVTFYLMELAGLFHPYYNKNRVVTEDEALSTARLLLCRAIAIVIASGLKLIGVSAPTKM